MEVAIKAGQLLAVSQLVFEGRRLGADQGLLHTFNAKHMFVAGAAICVYCADLCLPGRTCYVSAGQPAAPALSAWQHMAAAADAPGSQPGSHPSAHDSAANSPGPRQLTGRHCALHRVECETAGC
jgi:hypothetical protein